MNWVEMNWGEPKRTMFLNTLRLLSNHESEVYRRVYSIDRVPLYTIEVKLNRKAASGIPADKNVADGSTKFREMYLAGMIDKHYVVVTSSGFKHVEGGDNDNYATMFYILKENDDGT